MGSMFSGCSGLTSLDVKNFNAQKVTKMSWMFKGCSGLTSLDLSHFNTRKVSDMSEMFSGCSGLPSLDLSHFNTQKVTDMHYMFYRCSALTTINSNTAWQCPRSEGMFAGCTQLKGAVPYNGNKIDVRMANPETGYSLAQMTEVWKPMWRKARTKPPSPSTTMHFAPPAPARHGASRRRKRREMTPSLHGLEHGTWETVPPHVWYSMPRSETSVPPPPPRGSIIVKLSRK